ncbi:MAG: flagellar biosynthesis anti-sigma factor FlgM [Helicobacter sp.]|uniref:flagellar biosynthesis anti-sigma factor FlgM n=1 Tax=Helicobacter sp. TaxID=218 RepID=UPI003752B592|nr:flagellar biosynthesis anti-sigma factor FlgM [Helicobacter sp.]
MVSGVNSSIVATNALGVNRNQRRDGGIQAQGNEENKEMVKEVAFDKVSDIKERIAKGTYVIDIYKTSRKMASDLLNL